MSESTKEQENRVDQEEKKEQKTQTAAMESMNPETSDSNNPGQNLIEAEEISLLREALKEPEQTSHVGQGVNLIARSLPIFEHHLGHLPEVRVRLE